MHWRFIANVVLALVIVGLLSACGPAAEPAPSPGAPAPDQSKAQPKYGGTVKLVALGPVNVVDPHKTLGVTGPDLSWSLVANSLLRLEWVKMNIQPNLVESWDWNDPKTLTLKLKKGVHFQKESLAKGREMDAKDVIANLERIRTKDPTFTNAQGYIYVDTYEEVDKYTVRVKFKKPDANFLYWLTLPMAPAIVPREAIDKFGNNLAQREAWYGTGPFVVDQDAYKADVSGAAKRNPDYDVEKGLPYLDRVEWYTIADASTRLAALRTGQIDIGLVPTREADWFRQRKFQMGSTENTPIAGQHLAMNVQLPPTSDWRVRKAIHLAIDREELKQVVGDGFACIPIILGCRTALYLSETEWAEKPGFRKDKSKDIAEAKVLLAEAGVPPGTTLKMLSSAQNPYKVHYEQALAIQGILERNLGLKVELKPGVANYHVPDVVKKEGAHLINVSHGGVGGIIIDVALWNHLHSTSWANASLWNDPKTDELIEKQATTLDPKERVKIFAEIQRYLLEDKVLPVAPTARNYDWWAAVPQIRNWIPSSYFLSNYTWQFDRVWLDK